MSVCLSFSLPLFPYSPLPLFPSPLLPHHMTSLLPTPAPTPTNRPQRQSLTSVTVVDVKREVSNTFSLQLVLAFKLKSVKSHVELLVTGSYRWYMEHSSSRGMDMLTKSAA